MDLNAWQKNWDELGKDDPLWLVISDPSKAGGKWNPDEFFATGRQEISQVLEEARARQLTIPRGRALDFGCGVGRLSQALAQEFDEVQGVDISPSMIGHAKWFNQFPEKCHFHINAENSLPMFPSDHFDFIYSGLTLQHIEQQFALNYIREFVRVCKPGGVIIFQIISPVLWRSLVPKFAVEAWRQIKHGKKPYIGMFGLSRRQVARTLNASGAKVADVVARSSDTTRFNSYQYFATKISAAR